MLVMSNILPVRNMIVDKATTCLSMNYANKVSTLATHGLHASTNSVIEVICHVVLFNVFGVCISTVSGWCHLL